MADSNTNSESTTPDSAEAANGAVNEGQTDGEKPGSESTDWKAEARKWEQRAKANLAAADELEQIKESNKTEAQKHAERIAHLEEEISTSKSVALRSQISVEFGISKEDQDTFITASDEEGMRAQAKRLSELTADRKKQMHVPKEGNVTDTAGSEDRRAFVRQLTGRG